MNSERESIREEAVAGEVDILTGLTVFFKCFERVERREEDMRQVFPFIQGNSYIFQVIKNLVDYLQTFNNFPGHIELLVKEGIVWEWSGVKGYVEVCSMSMCHCHLKTRVLVPMRHQ